MGKGNNRVETARAAYRDALETARAHPSPEAWARLLAAGKELSLAQEPRAARTGRRSRRAAGVPTLRELEPEPEPRAPEPELRTNPDLMGTLE